MAELVIFYRMSVVRSGGPLNIMMTDALSMAAVIQPSVAGVPSGVTVVPVAGKSCFV